MKKPIFWMLAGALALSTSALADGNQKMERWKAKVAILDATKTPVKLFTAGRDHEPIVFGSQGECDAFIHTDPDFPGNVAKLDAMAKEKLGPEFGTEAFCYRVPDSEPSEL
jgi:hypothetical protein